MSTKEIKLGTEQTVANEESDVEVTIEALPLAKLVEICISKKPHNGGVEDEQVASVAFTRDELWEHVHNCLEALTRMK